MPEPLRLAFRDRDDTRRGALWVYGLNRGLWDKWPEQRGLRREDVIRSVLLVCDALPEETWQWVE